MSKIDFGKIIAKVRAVAADRRESAAYNGSWDDGGAAGLLRDIEFFEYGMAGKVPPQWQKYYQATQNEADPEYETYVRLKNKFKGK